jgi:sugar lactone lactonase YvrE
VKTIDFETGATQMTTSTVFLTGQGFVECPRWHGGRFWFADWTRGEILAVDEYGSLEAHATSPAPPLSFDFSRDGRMLIVQSRLGQLLRREADGQLAVFAELGDGIWNEIVVDGRGNTYVNGPQLLLITPEGKVSSEATDLAFPNGMAVTRDNQTLILAESHGRRLTAFDIGFDGHLSNRRVWAQLEGPPDGICIDHADAVWYADVPNRCCRRVQEGGTVLDEVTLDRGAFACMLGGTDRRTLLIVSAKWFGMDGMAEMAGTGQLITVPVSVPGTGWP